MTKKQKKNLYKIVVSVLLFITICFLVHFLTFHKILVFLLFLVPYLIAGRDTIKKAIFGVRNKQVFDENFLMLIATVGAFAIGEYPEAVFVMLFNEIGQFFENLSVTKSRNSIKELMNLCPDKAFIEKDGKICEVSPEEINVGDEIIIPAGTKVPIDCTITSGESYFDTSAMTGESAPLFAHSGDGITSGFINGNTTVRAKTICSFENSAVSRVLYLVEESAKNKAKYESFITRFAKYYTPIVVILALIIGIVTPLLIMLFNMTFDTHLLSSFFKRALILLVVSCPCALCVSVPLSFFAGIGAASKKGILIKGASFIELLSKSTHFVFDKTGTLTKGTFEISDIFTQDGVSKENLLEICALCESYSSHPVSVPLKQAFDKNLDLTRVSEVCEISGFGIQCKIDGKDALCGSLSHLQRGGINASPKDCAGTCVYVSFDGQYLGYITVSDAIKEKSRESISTLKKLGAKKMYMLSGDTENVCREISQKLGIDKYFSRLLPDGKLKELDKIIKSAPKNQTVCFVGDGTNDAPSLMKAHVGISMGNIGSDAAIEASGIVIIDGKIEKVPVAVKISKDTISKVKQNIIFCLAVKFGVMILGIFGYANMWLASFADVGVLIIAIINAVRQKKY